ncbi:MAG TPA: hypothetical protein DCP85_09050, partial [Elusimicrobia bacterium]|nr:hypothetical protein [Elusimicrobiota bacterium]
MTNNDSAYPASGADINKVYATGAAGDWLALEIISDIGTMGHSDGTTELYIYDKAGNIKGHYSAAGQLKLTQFDHYYNKITLGGNRRTGTTSSHLDGRYWLDDFIVDDSRIGPTYFSTLAAFDGGKDTASPSAPANPALGNPAASSLGLSWSASTDN